MDFFADIFSTAVVCFTVPYHRRLVGCDQDLETLQTQSVLAALEASTNISLSEEGAEAAEVVK